MSRREIIVCDSCGCLHDCPEKPRGWMWTQRYDGVASSKDLCERCVSKIFRTTKRPNMEFAATTPAPLPGQEH